MKTFLTILILFMSTAMFAQRGTSSSDNSVRGSTVLIVGGVGFQLLGFTSCLDWDYVGGKQVYRPIYKNGNSTVAVVTGFTLTITGLITMATENKGGKRHGRF